MLDLNIAQSFSKVASLKWLLLLWKVMLLKIIKNSLNMMSHQCFALFLKFRWNRCISWVEYFKHVTQHVVTPQWKRYSINFSMFFCNPVLNCFEKTYLQVVCNSLFWWDLITGQLILAEIKIPFQMLQDLIVRYLVHNKPNFGCLSIALVKSAS